MGLNVSFKGNVSDENDDAIDCKYQVHYVRQNVWNDTRDTASAYYSANAGDADSLTQDGELKANDVILVSFWQGDGSGGPTPDNRDSLFDRFGVYAIIHDGSTADYVINVQLKPKLAPDISWSLPSTARINRNVHASDYSDDESAWSYEDKTIYHRNTYYGRTVFPKVGLLTTTFNWNDDNDDEDSYEVSDDHSFVQIGDYLVDLHIVNAWDLYSDDQKPIRLKYNLPIGNLSFNPNGTSTKVHTTEDSTYTAGITDEDSRITSIDHKWYIKDRDNGNEISDTLVETNTTLDYQFTKTIEILQRHYGKQIISWNDGWDDLVITYLEELPITNWKPLVNFSQVSLNDTKLKFTPSCSDIDGTVDRYTWRLYALVPFQDGEYTLAKTDVFNDDQDLEIEFDAAGHYKMVLTGRDDYGDDASFTREFDITGGGDCTTVEMISDDCFFIFPDKIDY